jgi:hypothetical protein
MVSVVFDRFDSPDTPAVRDFIKQTHDAIDALSEPLRDRIQPAG